MCAFICVWVEPKTQYIVLGLIISYILDASNDGVIGFVPEWLLEIVDVRSMLSLTISHGHGHPFQSL